ncbi:MAG: glycosyltransferase [Verrucomicrobiota bacterium]|jgi:glycosyltransferase involved in cell wall biosynthesis
MPPTTPLTVAWISDFPIEWLPDIPEPLRQLPRQHPATWEMVLLAEFERNPALQIHVIILRKNISRGFSFQRHGVTFHLLKYLGGTRGPTLFWLDTLLIRRALRRIKPDIVHAWGSERGAGLVATRLGYPSLVTMQGLFTWFAELFATSAHDKLIAWGERHCLSRARNVSTESKFAVAYLQTRYPRLAIHQIEHAPNWVFHKVQRQPATAPLRFLTYGTLGYAKGTDLLLLALNELVSEFSFEAVIIGKPNDRFLAPFKTRLSPELWRRLTFKSNLQPAEIADELSKATIFLFPTRADTSPNAVKEAVVAGVPVVGSKVGGIPDYVIPGENGLLFASGDEAEFVAMIRAAAAHPLFSHGNVTPSSLAKHREYLSPVRMAQLFLSAYQDVTTR